MVPYAPAVATATDQARAFLTADVVATDTTLKVPIADVYKFAVGDVIVLHEPAGTPTYNDCGAITAIDVTTYPGVAEITFTNALTDPGTVANGANIYHKTAAASPYSAASFICDQDVFTGADENAKGANTSVVISNAILYKSALVGYDSAAAATLGIVEDGNHAILK